MRYYKIIFPLFIALICMTFLFACCGCSSIKKQRHKTSLHLDSAAIKEASVKELYELKAKLMQRRIDSLLASSNSGYQKRTVHIKAPVKTVKPHPALDGTMVIQPAVDSTAGDGNMEITITEESGHSNERRNIYSDERLNNNVMMTLEEDSVASEADAVQVDLLDDDKAVDKKKFLPGIMIVIGVLGFLAVVGGTLWFFARKANQYRIKL